ncbi:protein CASP-like isoform X1 [Hibiscus syriacus]|uniref:protein CASP-like isoform X1 n=1 Tax=Hibiscus syriacus TaxID=106335 RepID=UPI0019220CF2|nr:protein CASP-like isoform X1 [Hibiscus syriacus]
MCMHICKGGRQAGRFELSCILTKACLMIVTLSGLVISGSKIVYARTFAFFYTIGLHILVFTCLYRVSALSYLSHGSEEPLVVEKNLNLPRRH